MWFLKPQNCRDSPHRGPEGPNEDIAQCGLCGSVSWEKRPPDETYGDHREDCSLPIDHESYCKPGGNGHPRAKKIRGYFPPIRTLYLDTLGRARKGK